MYVYTKGIKFGQLSSQDMALNIHEKGFIIPKTIDIIKSKKMRNVLCRSSLVECRQVG